MSVDAEAKVAKLRAGARARDQKTGRRLRALRKKHGITGRFVAAKMGITAPRLVHLEKGRRPWTPGLEKGYLDAIGEDQNQTQKGNEQ